MFRHLSYLLAFSAFTTSAALSAQDDDTNHSEAPENQIDADVAKLKECMSEASEGVLGTGKICRVDAEIVKYPNRYMDEQGQEMWNKIMIILEKVKE